MPTTTRDERLPGEVAPRGEQARDDDLPVWRIGVLGGLVGILCCVGPTVLALLGIVSAGTAFAVATDLYEGFAWWFRAAGLLTIGGLVFYGLRQRDRCTVALFRKM